MRERPTSLCRSWLFCPGVDEQALMNAAKSGADVVIQELEDFTPRHQRPFARMIARGIFNIWRRHGRRAAVRINSFSDEGQKDLSAVMQGRPDIVALPKVKKPHQIKALCEAIAAHERSLGLPEGVTEILPNLESAAGVNALNDICAASPRVTACLMTSEDLAHDLGAARQPDNAELAYARQKFFFDAAAAGVLAVDYPHTWAQGLLADLQGAKRLGYSAKSCIRAQDVAAINAAFSPSEDEITQARTILAAFENASHEGKANTEADGILVELPRVNSACRLLDRADALARCGG